MKGVFPLATSRFPIPVFRFFLNENPFCGSVDAFNYRLIPVKAKPEEDIEKHFEVYTWYGPLCSDLSPRQAEATFPLDENGLKAAIQWLEEQYAGMA